MTCVITFLAAFQAVNYCFSLLTDDEIKIENGKLLSLNPDKEAIAKACLLLKVQGEGVWKWKMLVCKYVDFHIFTCMYVTVYVFESEGASVSD